MHYWPVSSCAPGRTRWAARGPPMILAGSCPEAVGTRPVRSQRFRQPRGKTGGAISLAGSYSSHNSMKNVLSYSRIPMHLGTIIVLFSFGHAGCAGAPVRPHARTLDDSERPAHKQGSTGTAGQATSSPSMAKPQKALTTRRPEVLPAPTLPPCQRAQEAYLKRLGLPGKRPGKRIQFQCSAPASSLKKPASFVMTVRRIPRQDSVVAVVVDTGEIKTVDIPLPALPPLSGTRSTWPEPGQIEAVARRQWNVPAAATLPGITMVVSPSQISPTGNRPYAILEFKRLVDGVEVLDNGMLIRVDLTAMVANYYYVYGWSKIPPRIWRVSAKAARRRANAILRSLRRLYPEGVAPLSPPEREIRLDRRRRPVSAYVFHGGPDCSRSSNRFCGRKTGFTIYIRGDTGQLFCVNGIRIPEKNRCREYEPRRPRRRIPQRILAQKADSAMNSILTRLGATKVSSERQHRVWQVRVYEASWRLTFVEQYRVILTPTDVQLIML